MRHIATAVVTGLALFTLTLSACGHNKFNCVAYATYTCLDPSFTGKDPALYIKALYAGPTFSVLSDQSCSSQATGASDDQYHFSSTYCDANATPATGANGQTICTLQTRQVAFDPTTRTALASDLSDGANASAASCSLVKSGKRSL